MYSMYIISFHGSRSPQPTRFLVAGQKIPLYNKMLYLIIQCPSAVKRLEAKDFLLDLLLTRTKDLRKLQKITSTVLTISISNFWVIAISWSKLIKKFSIPSSSPYFLNFFSHTHFGVRHPNLKTQKSKILFAIILLNRNDAIVFLETSSWIWGFVEDNIHLKSALFQFVMNYFLVCFVLIMLFIVIW